MSKNVDNDFDIKLIQEPKLFSKWYSKSMEWLLKAEEKLFSVVKSRLDKRYVPIFDNTAVLWTVTAKKEESNKTPLVLVHGYASGVGMWCLNFDELSRNRSVYSFDLIGFGRSTRINFPKTSEKVEDKFVESIEDWRKKENVEKFHLLGHSFGGFLVGCYALKYPEHVQSLIFADPWGFPIHKVDDDKSSLVRWGKSVHNVLVPFNPLSSEKSYTPWESSQWVDNLLKAFGPLSPLSIIRAAGPLGPKVIGRFKDNYKTWFSTVDDKQEYAIYHYLYHCNSFKPTGERAFTRIIKGLHYESLPMIVRIRRLRPGIPVTFIYGARSWISSEWGFETQKNLPNSDIAVYVVEEAGHHLYAEKPDEFNRIVNTRCSECD